MRNYEVFNKIYGSKPSIKSSLFINKLLGLNKLSKDEIINELACRHDAIYVPNFDPYEEIEKKWLLTEFGKDNFDKWYEEGKNTPGDSIYVIQSYIFEEPEIRIRKVLIDTTDKSLTYIVKQKLLLTDTTYHRLLYKDLRNNQTHIFLCVY
jgi:hypothetical protein